jgi:hypothetical protein
MNGDISLEIHSEPREDCRAIWPALSLYADTEASDYQRMLVETHVRQCAQCSGELHAMRTASTLLANIAELSPPPYLRKRILAATVGRGSVAGWFSGIARSTVRFTPARYGTVALAGVLAAAYVSVERSGHMIPIRNELAPSARTLVLAKTPKPLSRNSIQFNGSASSPVQTITSPAPIGKYDADVDNFEIAKASSIRRGARLARSAAVERISAFAPAPGAAGRVASMQLSYKAKPREPQPAVDDMVPDLSDPKEPVMIPVEGGMVTADIKTPMITGADMETTSRSPSVSRIPFSASSGIPSEQAASLAGLKQALKQQSLGWNVGELRQSLRDKQIRIDLIKRSF